MAFLQYYADVMKKAFRVLIRWKYCTAILKKEDT